MPENQAKPTIDQKIEAMEGALSKLIATVNGLVSRKDSRSDAHRDDDRRDDDRRDDDRRDDDDKRDDDKAKKDAARDTLFGGKRKDAKRDDDKRDDDRRDDEAEDEEEEEKESKGDAKRDDDEGEAEPMASDDDRRKDRRKDAKRDDAHRDDKRRDDDRRDDDDDRRDDGRRKDAKRDDEAEDEEEKEERDDARRYDDKRDDARADSMIRSLKREMEELRRSVRRPRIMTDDELNELSEKQGEWDKVAQMHGLRAARPLDGERIASYDRRMAKVFQKHSAKWKDADLSAMPIDAVTRIIAPEIRADAVTAAYRVDPAEGGMQREVRRQDRTGRWISEFVGPVNAANGALAPFRMAPMRVMGINTNPNRF